MIGIMPERSVVGHRSARPTEAVGRIAVAAVAIDTVPRVAAIDAKRMAALLVRARPGGRVVPDAVEMASRVAVHIHILAGTTRAASDYCVRAPPGLRSDDCANVMLAHGRGVEMRPISCLEEDVCGAVWGDPRCRY